MKKGFVIFLAFCGIAMVLKGVFSFFSFHFYSILENHIAYNIGHNFGLVFRKIAKIIIGAFLIKFCYDWFCEQNKTQNS
jgi:hypothetical protein